MTLQIEETVTTDFTAREVLVAFATLVANRYDYTDNLEELIDNIENSSYGISSSLSEVDFEWDDYVFSQTEKVDGVGWVRTPLPVTIRGEQYVVTCVDQTGGMDEGSNASITFRVGSQFFQKQGYYASHYGYDWDGPFREVQAVEKTVVVYE